MWKRGENIGKNIGKEKSATLKVEFVVFGEVYIAIPLSPLLFRACEQLR